MKYLMTLLAIGIMACHSNRENNQGKIMKCPHCEKASTEPIEFPLSTQELLYGDMATFESTTLNKCMYCNNKFLGIGFQVRDDYLDYWAQATDEEIDSALTLKSKSEVFKYVTKVIEQKEIHIYRFNQSSYIKNKKAVIMSGRPSW